MISTRPSKPPRNDIRPDMQLIELKIADLRAPAHETRKRIDHLSEPEQRVLHLAINRMTANGEWNLDALRWRVLFRVRLFLGNRLGRTPRSRIKTSTGCRYRAIDCK
jgi:hypothetical protein